MTSGQELALGILLAIVLFKWVLPQNGAASKLSQIWNAAWTSPPSNPFTSSLNPFAPVTVGKGGDVAQSSTLSSDGVNPLVTMGGSLSANPLYHPGGAAGLTFTPSDNRFKPFTCAPGGVDYCAIPSSVIDQVASLGLIGKGWISAGLHGAPN